MTEFFLCYNVIPPEVHAGNESTKRTGYDKPNAAWKDYRREHKQLVLITNCYSVALTCHKQISFRSLDKQLMSFSLWKSSSLTSKEYDMIESECLLNPVSLIQLSALRGAFPMLSRRQRQLKPPSLITQRI